MLIVGLQVNMIGSTCLVNDLSLSHLERYGAAIQPPRELVLPNPEYLYMVCYTSGTTGPPKGKWKLYLAF